MKVFAPALRQWWHCRVIRAMSFNRQWLSKANVTIHEIHEIARTKQKAVPLADLILKEEVYQIVGAAMDVYYQLGCGFLEPIYQEAFEIELGRRGIPYKPQCELTTYY